MREPGGQDLAESLRRRWEAVGGRELPADTLWNAVAEGFRSRAAKQMILTPELRARLEAQSIEERKEMHRRQGGVGVEARIEGWDITQGSRPQN